MTDHNALLAEIIANPADDLPRLAYADWLDEHAGKVPCPGVGCDGDGLIVNPEEPDGSGLSRCEVCRGTGSVSNLYAERAELIRAQCEIHRRLPENGGKGDAWKLDALRRREKELFARLNPLMRPDLTWAACTPENADPSDWEPHDKLLIVDRGFVARIRGPLAAFWEEQECGDCDGNGRPNWYARHGSCPSCSGTGRVSGPTPALVELLRREPVARDGIEVTILRPWEDPEPGIAPGYSFAWWRASSWEGVGTDHNRNGNLPDSLFNAVAETFPESRLLWGGPPSNQHLGFDSPDAARLALSAALWDAAKAADPKEQP